MLDIRSTLRWRNDVPWYINTRDFNAASGDMLLKGLEGRHQLSFRHPEKVADKLFFDDPLNLRAMNCVSHSALTYALFNALTQALEFDHRRMRLREQAFHVTLLDHAMVRGVSKFVVDEDPRNPSREAPTHGLPFSFLVSRLAQALPSDVDYVGVVELEVFVSTQRVSGWRRFFQYHPHLIVWGCTEDELNRHLRPFKRRALTGLTPYPPVVIKSIATDRLPRVVSYLPKMPCRRRQVYRVTKHSGEPGRERRVITTGTGPLPPIDLVRCARELAGVTLPDLMISSGRGDQVVENAQKPDLLWEGFEAMYIAPSSCH